MSRVSASIFNKNSNVIKIEFEAFKPEEATAYANIYQYMYLEETLNLVDNELNVLKNYLQEQKYEKETLLFEAERTKNVYMKTEGINLFDQQASVKLNNIAEKEQKLELSRLLRAAESQMFDWLKKYNVKTSTRSRKSEWFRGKASLFKAEFGRLALEFGSMFDIPVLRFKEPFVHIFDIDGLEVDVLKELDLTDKIEEVPGIQVGKRVRRSGRVVRAPRRYALDYLFFR